MSNKMNIWDNIYQMAYDAWLLRWEEEFLSRFGDDDFEDFERSRDEIIDMGMRYGVEITDNMSDQESLQLIETVREELVLLFKKEMGDDLKRLFDIDPTGNNLEV